VIKFVILLYHGVTNQKHGGIQNCSQKHIFSKDFQNQMKVLSNNYNVLAFNELIRLKKSGKLPNNSVSVTFDDGFANNYSIAFPILKKYEIPATFYLSTGFINSHRTFWVDKVEYLLNETEEPVIEIDSLEKEFFIRSIEEKMGALREIKSQLKADSNLIEPLVQELEQKAKIFPKYDYKDYAMLTWDNVRSMDHSGLCEFGAHTVDHVILSHLSKTNKEYQICTSKKMLEDELEHEITLFSYPEGQKDQYDSETISILRKAGFNSSPTAIFGVNNQYISNFKLFRNMVGFKAPFKKCLEAIS